jgi:hypothetical protein
MQGSSWMALLERVPADQFDNLLFITNNGTGISVKGVVRAESEYVIVRGRLLGAAEEGGGFFFLPYDQINFVGFQRQIKEAVIHSMYDGTAAPTRLGSVPKPEAADGSEAASAASPAPAPTPNPDSDSAGAPRPAVAPGKAALLERLRARRTSDEMPKS